MPVACEFVFTRATPIYYNGEQICGSVHYTSNKRLTLTAIKLTLIGVGQIQWVERAKVRELIEHNDYDKADNRICYNGHHEHHHDCQRLTEGITIEANKTYTHNFSFTVPEQCAATCRLRYGEVAYHLQLTLQRKSVHNKVYKQRIVVKNKYDLNMQPQLREPHHETANIPNQPPITFSLPRTGFVPGQFVPFTLQWPPVESFNKIYISLCQRCIYSALKPVEHQKEVTSVLATERIRPDIPSLLYTNALNLPLSVAITTDNLKYLIRVSYHIIAVFLNEKRKVLHKLSIPIIVGNVPFEGQISDTNNIYNPQFCYDNLGSTECMRTTTDLPVELKQHCLQSDQYIYQKEQIRISDRIKLLKLHNKSLK